MSQYITTIRAFAELQVDVLETDRDAVTVITGDPGEGKSVFNYQDMRECAKIVRQRGIGKGWFNPVRQLIFDRDEFNTAIDHEPRFSGLAADEAVGLFYSRDYHDDHQIALLKKLDRIRYRNLVLNLLIPHLFHIDKHIRDARVRFWVYIDQRKGKGKDGFAHAYILQREKNPFNADPWNLTLNAKLYRQGRISQSPNYVGEIVFKDMPAEDHVIYQKVKDLKRKIAESKEWRAAQQRKRRYGSTGEKHDKRLGA